NEYEFITSRVRAADARGAVGSSADPDRALHVDRRFRALPHGGEAIEGAVPVPARGRALDLAVRTPRRLHARAPPGDRGRPSPQTALARRTQGAGYPSATRELWHRPGHAAHLEGRAGAVPRRYPGAHRLGRRVALRAGQRPALWRAQAFAHVRPMRGARPARPHHAAGKPATAGIAGAFRRGNWLARTHGPRR